MKLLKKRYELVNDVNESLVRQKQPVLLQMFQTTCIFATD